MTKFEEFDKALKAKGWRYDIGSDRFLDGDRRLDYQKVLGLVRGMTLGELSSYVNEKHHTRRKGPSP